MKASIASILLLVACGGDDAPAPPPTPAPAVPNDAVATASARPQDAEHPWTAFARALEGVDDGRRSVAIQEVLDARERHGKAEGQRIEGQLVRIQTLLAASCQAEGIDEAFREFQERERASLEADRATLVAILEAAGPDGRKVLWEDEDLAETASRTRLDLVQRQGSQTLPTWLAMTTDPDQSRRAHRLIVSLHFLVDSVSLEAKAELSDFEAYVAELDPAHERTPAHVAEHLASIDQVLLDGQNTRFRELVGACPEVEEAQWLSLLVSGTVAGYIGQLGGTMRGGASSTSGASSAVLPGSGQAGMGPEGSQGAMGGPGGGMGGPGGTSGMGGPGGTSGMGSPGDPSGMGGPGGPGGPGMQGGPGTQGGSVGPGTQGGPVGPGMQGGSGGPGTQGGSVGPGTQGGSVGPGTQGGPGGPGMQGGPGGPSPSGQPRQ